MASEDQVNHYFDYGILTICTYFASSTRASIPAASGAAEDVPLKTSVHL